jgi:hypothetical protein
MIDREDRERLTTARHAAEALFAPKPEAHKPDLSDPGQPAAARKPRVLPVVPPVPIRREIVEKPTASTPPAALEIPARKLARLRALIKYGLTTGQVAELEQLLRKR